MLNSCIFSSIHFDDKHEQSFYQGYDFWEEPFYLNDDFMNEDNAIITNTNGDDQFQLT